MLRTNDIRTSVEESRLMLTVLDYVVADTNLVDNSLMMFSIIRLNQVKSMRQHIE